MGYSAFFAINIEKKMKPRIANTYTYVYIETEI